MVYDGTLYQVAIGRYTRGDTRTKVSTSMIRLHWEFHAATLYAGEPPDRGIWARGSLGGEANRRVVDWILDYRPANQHGRIPTPLSEALTIMALSDTLSHLAVAANHSGLESASDENPPDTAWGSRWVASS
jgi:hypothetical protein